jgi:hypothetical protein
MRVFENGTKENIWARERERGEEAKRKRNGALCDWVNCPTRRRIWALVPQRGK